MALILWAHSNDIEGILQCPHQIQITTHPSLLSLLLCSPLSKDALMEMADEEPKPKILMYHALMKKEYRKVGGLCRELNRGPLEEISIYKDTVLHMAAHSKQKDLVLKLVKMLPADPNQQLADIKNDDGNTILHEVATSNTMICVAEELLSKDENLLFACNKLGEKPIFCAARYGQTQMFDFLAKKMKLEKLSREDSKAHLQRNDGTTVLHISITAECLDMALYIIYHYSYLIKEKDQFSMTTFQYLACNPIAFQKGEKQKRRGFIEQLVKSKAQIKESFMIQEYMDFLIDLYEEFFGRDMVKYERLILKEFIEKLTMKDTSWDASTNSQVVGRREGKELEIEHSTKLSRKNKGQNSQESSTNKHKKSDESPLFLATMSNFKDIVEVILYWKPEAFMHTNKEGMNILHVAILYRHIEIFDMVVNFEVIARRLLSAIDNEGNSVLHMVSQKRKSQASEKMQNPALQLRDELLLFEKVKSACKMLVGNPLNNENKTAEELFAASNEKLHQEAKEWQMRTTENCSIVSVFIATVAFAAAYTVPGGSDDKTGIPILKSKPFFMVFIVADLVSLTFALTSVGIFLSILTSSFPLEDFKTYLFKKLMQGITCLVLSVSMMAVAFGATIVLIMTHNPDNVAWPVVAFLPVPIFFLSYSHLRSAVLGTCREWFKIFVVYFLLVVTIVLLLPFKGLRWTVKKACEFITGTQPPQPPAAPGTEV